MSHTIILLIIDESASMLPKRTDVLRGYNKCIEDQKCIECDGCKIYSLKFNDKVTILEKGCDIQSAEQLTYAKYLPNNYTALYDAVGRGITMVEKEKKENEKVFCVIMTDGEENRSKEYNLEDVNELIKRTAASGDWKFLYIGENPENWTKKVGLCVTDGIPFNHSDCRVNFANASIGLSNFRNIPKKNFKLPSFLQPRP
jgi:hypothetical protein